jgi:hypothetical protein
VLSSLPAGGRQGLSSTLPTRANSWSPQQSQSQAQSSSPPELQPLRATPGSLRLPTAGSSANDLLRAEDSLAPWFYEESSKKVSQKALENGLFKDGLFLVRASKSQPGEFMLVLCYAGAPHNYRIKMTDDNCTEPRFSLDSSRSFPSLSALLQFYANSTLLGLFGGSSFLKQNPLLKPSFVYSGRRKAAC